MAAASADYAESCLLEAAENQGAGEFTRHSPELGIMQRILSRVPCSKRPQIRMPPMAPCLKFRCAKPLEDTLEAYVF